jgi:small subunit ribosomal protein S20
VAITSSAKKALRSSEKKRVFNVRRRKDMEDTIKDIEKLVEAKKIDEALKLVPMAYKAIDKAEKGNTIKKNKASRTKSRLLALINKNKTK